MATMPVDHQVTGPLTMGSFKAAYDKMKHAQTVAAMQFAGSSLAQHSHKDVDLLQAMQRTATFWAKTRQQFCPEQQKGDVLLVPGWMFDAAVRLHGLVATATPSWVVKTHALEGEIVYFIPGGSTRIQALGMDRNMQPQAIPAQQFGGGSRYFDLQD